MSEGHLMHAAVELVKELNKTADAELPGKLAGIVKLHAGLAVAAAIIPVPGADIIAAGANIWTMYYRINEEVNISFAENFLKSVATGLATNLGGLLAGSLVIGSVVKFFPGIGSVTGAMIMGGTVYSITLVSGIIYMKVLTKLLSQKDASDISEQDIRDSVASELKNKSELREVLKKTKDAYKPS